jgi:hypothetical protein
MAPKSDYVAASLVPSSYGPLTPDLIVTSSNRHEVQVKNDRGNLPLHSAASFRAPLEVTEALLEAYPEAASMTNNYGNLALHFTAWKKGPLEVEKLFLKVFPEGAAQKNNHGNPLHHAAHNAPLEVVETLSRVPASCRRTTTTTLLSTRHCGWCGPMLWPQGEV